jgi:signal transduction histidine kinase
MDHADERASSTAHAPRPRTPAEQVAFLSRLAGGLAHEIKNPLSTMAINLALLEEEWTRSGASRNPAAPELSPREQRSLKRVKTLQREVSRLEHIVEEFLHFARGAQINRAPHDLAQLVRELLEFVEPEDERQGIRHHAELPAGMPLVMLDETAFKQAVLNLLKNAREAMQSGGELMVRLRRGGNWAELAITDTGVGMGAEALEHCFDEYWSDKKGGTGLGLPTTRRIVEEHGGAISVVSEKGRGTSFTIYLPLVVEIPRTPRPDGGEDESAREDES